MKQMLVGAKKDSYYQYCPHRRRTVPLPLPTTAAVVANVPPSLLFFWLMLFSSTTTTAAWILPHPVVAPARHPCSAPITTTLYAAANDSHDDDDVSFVDSDDPFAVLQIDPTTDRHKIKRAYKRMALRFHPDMVVNNNNNSGGNSQEAAKKLAGERFAKINAAYQALTGQGSASGSSSSNKKTSSTATSSSWEPPHRRRQRQGSSTSSSTTTDWRDFIPNNNYNDDDARYDADGDSFGQIFADLLAGVAAGAASGGSSGGGLFQDFVEFLEANVEGMSTGGEGTSSDKNTDAEWQRLLRTGSRQEIAEEMDDAQLLVQQLATKARSLEDQVWTLQAELRQVRRFSEQIQLQEELEELQARQKVIKGYERKAQKRLVKLQTRYKELIVSGRADVEYEDTSWSRRSRNRSTTPERDNNAYTNQPYASTNDPSSQSSTSSRTSDIGNSRPNGTSSQQDSWQTESFGSFGRRGSARGRSRPARKTSSTARTARDDRDALFNDVPSSSSPPPGSDQSNRASFQRNTNGASATTTSGSSYNNNNNSPSSAPSSTPSTTRIPARTARPGSKDAYVPPHRRASSVEADKRRLRDLKVDEEFENLKRELGL